MKYKLLKEKADKLAVEVEFHLDQGWKLHGNPFTVNPYEVVCQAVIRQPLPVADNKKPGAKAGLKVQKGKD